MLRQKLIVRRVSRISNSTYATRHVMRGLYVGFTCLVYLYTIYTNMPIMLLVLGIHSDNAKYDKHMILCDVRYSKRLVAYGLRQTWLIIGARPNDRTHPINQESGTSEGEVICGNHWQPTTSSYNRLQSLQPAAIYKLLCNIHCRNLYYLQNCEIGLFVNLFGRLGILNSVLYA